MATRKRLRTVPTKPKSTSSLEAEINPAASAPADTARVDPNNLFKLVAELSAAQQETRQMYTALAAKEESSKVTGNLLSEQDRNQAYRDSKVQATNESILLTIKTGSQQAESYTNGLTTQCKPTSGRPGHSTSSH